MAKLPRLYRIGATGFRRRYCSIAPSARPAHASSKEHRQLPSSTMVQLAMVLPEKRSTKVALSMTIENPRVLARDTLSCTRTVKEKVPS